MQGLGIERYSESMLICSPQWISVQNIVSLCTKAWIFTKKIFTYQVYLEWCCKAK